MDTMEVNRTSKYYNNSCLKSKCFEDFEKTQNILECSSDSSMVGTWKQVRKENNSVDNPAWFQMFWMVNITSHAISVCSCMLVNNLPYFQAWSCSSSQSFASLNARRIERIQPCSHWSGNLDPVLQEFPGTISSMDEFCCQWKCAGKVMGEGGTLNILRIYLCIPQMSVKCLVWLLMTETQLKDLSITFAHILQLVKVVLPWLHSKVSHLMPCGSSWCCPEHTLWGLWTLFLICWHHSYTDYVNHMHFGDRSLFLPFFFYLEMSIWNT